MKKRDKYVDEIFGYLIEDNFCPDGVICGLLDCFDEGQKIGFVQGVMFSAGLTAAGYLAIKINKKFKGEHTNENK